MSRANHLHAQTVPRTALWAAAFLIILTLVLAAIARRDGHRGPAARVIGQEQPQIEQAMLRFEDRPDGTLAVLDADTGREVRLIPPETNGFIRGVLRGMFRNRKLESMARGDARFRLAREATSESGGKARLTLEDPDSGRRVDLDSFGPTNSEAFADLLLRAQGRVR